MSNRKRLAVLANPESWYLRDLHRAAQELGQVELVALSYRHLAVERLMDGRLQAWSEAADGEPLMEDGSDHRIMLDHHDALLVRTMPLGSLEQVIFRMNVLHAAADRGLPIYNPPRTLEIAIDKWLTLDFARRAGLEVPRTIVCQNRDAALVAFERLGKDVVVKPIFGGEGRGLLRVDSEELAWRVFSALDQTGAVHYLQEYVPHSGFDLRILIVGDKHFSVARHAVGGDWRTNVSRGGKAIPHEPTSAQLEMAFRAAEAVGGSIIGVDLLPAKDGRLLLLEVNAVPGWRGTAKALGIDLAQIVLRHLLEPASSR